MTYIVLVLVSFGLVLLATILLVVGLLTDDGLTLIYLSIAASFTAAVVLYLAFRKARPKADTDLQPPTPIAPEGAEDEELAAPPREEPTIVAPAVTTPEAVVAASEEPEAEVVEEPEPVLVGAGGAPAAEDWTTDDDWADDGDFDVEFPIADYDDLTVAEIMPLLPQLYSDELGIVAERERKGKNRSTILARLDELAATGTAADALEAEIVDVEPESEPMPAAAEAAAAAVGSRDETLAAPRPPAAVPQVPSLADDDYDDGYVFPIADYDELSVDQIVPLLAQLEDDELEEVKEREASGQGRKTVIAEIDRQLGLVGAVDGDDELADDGWADERQPAASADGRTSPRAEAAEGSALAIAGYDGLTVAQIRPLLSGLSDHELRAVLEHEVARDNRSTIVAEIERRLDSPEPAAAPAATKTATRATKAPARKAATKKAVAKKSAKRATKKSAAKKSSRATKKAAAARFPIADYDDLTVAQIRPRLSKLSDDQLLQVRAREERGAGRKTILNDIASRLD